MASMTDGAPDHIITSPTSAQNGDSSAAPSTPSSALPALLPTPPLPPPSPASAQPAAQPAQPAQPSGLPPPCQTLYLHHLNEKTPLADLRKSLYLLFSQFGHVLSVSAARTDTTRGQAWVVMAGVEAAVRAVNEMDGLMVYGRPMKVEFAKEESDVARRARGETVPKREKRKRLSTTERKAQKVALLSAAQQQQQHQAPPQPSLPPPLPLPPNTAYPQPPPLFIPPPPPLPPNRVLFLEHLPPHLTHTQLHALWVGQSGLAECRLVAVRPGVGFVEFVGEAEAGEAMRRMQGLKVEDGYEMRISYAKK